MSNAGKPKLSVTVFSDYVCPFCYVGHARLAKLRDYFDLRVDWRSLEIHPETPPEGRPISQLRYPVGQWREMMENLAKMAEEEGLHFAERTFTTNSHKALLLAEAAKEEGDAVFNILHERLFKAYFTERQNIGDMEVLRVLAAEAGMSEKIVQIAWSNPRYEIILQQNLGLAARDGINGVPTFIISDQMLIGAVPTTMLLEAARKRQSRS